MNTCLKCGLFKSIHDFHTKNICLSCYKIRKSTYNSKRYAENLDFRKSKNDDSSRREREDRSSDIRRDKYIVFDSRKIDKKKNRENDIDRPFVSELISKPCFYCEDTETKMTLDRINNTIGHIKTNVVQCCVRCNYTRGQMPYDAWIIVSKGMKEARISGLFGNWTGNIRKSGK